jgi:hypothetical protein
LSGDSLWRSRSFLESKVRGREGAPSARAQAIVEVTETAAVDRAGPEPGAETASFPI